MIKCSVITVCFNNADTIEATIQSVLNQSYPDIEYVIIDGHSTDGTQELVKKYGEKIAVFRSEPDKGIYDALNKGIDLCTGEVVAILHADDLFAHDDVIKKVMDLMLGEEVLAVYGDLDYVDRADTGKTVRKWRSGSYDKKSFLFGWMPPHPAFFVRRKLYHTYGKFNLQLKSAADYELMLRLLYKHQIKAEYLPEVLVKMRAGGKSNASIQNRINANREDREAWKMNDLKPYFFTLYLKPLRKVFQFFA